MENDLLASRRQDISQLLATLFGGIPWSFASIHIHNFVCLLQVKIQKEIRSNRGNNKFPVPRHIAGRAWGFVTDRRSTVLLSVSLLLYVHWSFQSLLVVHTRKFLTVWKVKHSQAPNNRSMFIAVVEIWRMNSLIPTTSFNLSIVISDVACWHLHMLRSDSTTRQSN